MWQNPEKTRIKVDMGRNTNSKSKKNRTPPRNRELVYRVGEGLG
jgi:hypothetical protein